MFCLSSHSFNIYLEWLWHHILDNVCKDTNKYDKCHRGTQYKLNEIVSITTVYVMHFFVAFSSPAWNLAFYYVYCNWHGMVFCNKKSISDQLALSCLHLKYVFILMHFYPRTWTICIECPYHQLGLHSLVKLIVFLKNFLPWAIWALL